MAYGHIIANITTEVVGDVQHSVVLNIGTFPDNNLMNVASQHGIVPDARLLPECHRAKHNRRFGDVHLLADCRFLFEIFFESLID